MTTDDCGHPLRTVLPRSPRDITLSVLQGGPRAKAHHTGFLRRNGDKAFNRDCRRKEMFIDDRLDSFIPAAKSNTIPRTAYLALPRVHSDVGHSTRRKAPLNNRAPGVVPCHKNSDLSIRIPGVVDRLALRVGSCSVSRQTEEDEVVVDRVTQSCGLILGLVDRLRTMTNEGSCYSGYWGCAVGTWEAVNDTVHCAPHESYITQLVGVQLTHGDKKLMPLTVQYRQPSDGRLFARL